MRNKITSLSCKEFLVIVINKNISGTLEAVTINVAGKNIAYSSETS
jgi:hypothetical protein